MGSGPGDISIRADIARDLAHDVTRAVARDVTRAIALRRNVGPVASRAAGRWPIHLEAPMPLERRADRRADQPLTAVTLGPQSR